MFFSNLVYWDQQLSAWMVAHRTPAGNIFFRFITKLGDWDGILFVFFVLLWLLWRKRKKLTLSLWPLLSVGSSWIFLHVIKNIVQRSRPEMSQLVTAAGYSFPSMHAALSVLFYGWVAFLLNFQGIIKKKWQPYVRIGAGLLAFLIGISRVYVNVHYGTDVIVGWLMGGILLFISLRLYRDIYQPTNR